MGHQYFIYYSVCSLVSGFDDKPTPKIKVPALFFGVEKIVRKDRDGAVVSGEDSEYHASFAKITFTSDCANADLVGSHFGKGESNNHNVQIPNWACDLRRAELRIQHSKLDSLHLNVRILGGNINICSWFFFDCRGTMVN